MIRAKKTTSTSEKFSVRVWIISEYAKRGVNSVVQEFTKESVPLKFQNSDLAELRKLVHNKALLEKSSRIIPDDDLTIEYVAKLNSCLVNEIPKTEESKFLYRELVRCFDKKLLIFKRDGTLNQSYDYPDNKAFTEFLYKSGLSDKNELAIARKERKFTINNQELTELLEMDRDPVLRRNSDPGLNLTDKNNQKYLQLVEFFGLDYRKLIGSETDSSDLSLSGSFSKKR